MTDHIFDFAIGSRCKLSELGIARSPRSKRTTGTIVASGRSSVRVLFDGSAAAVKLHKKYIEPIPAAFDHTPVTKRPRDIAERSRSSRDLRRLEPDGFLRETFVLPLHAAHLKARRILDAYPAAGDMTIVEKWQQLWSCACVFVGHETDMPWWPDGVCS
jgi:hypothetical protein